MTGKTQKTSAAERASAAPLSSAQDVQVSVLIVAYNSADLISACIESVKRACTETAFEILMIDNGDGRTEQLVKDRFPKVRVVPSRGNIGFAAGNNALAAKARSQNLLLLNPDMVLKERAIDALLKGAATYPDAAAWGGVTVDKSGKPDTGNSIAMPSLGEFASVAMGRSRIGGRSAPGVAFDTPVEVLVGGFVMFNRKAWEQADGLDENFFLYSEEVDLFYRLSKAGWRFWRIASARGFHEVAHGENFSPLRLLYRAAGSAEFVRKHWSRPASILAIALIWLAALERFVAGRVLGLTRPNKRKLSYGYRRVALQPGLWIFGYDDRRGLIVKLERQSRSQR